jgi:hypothetical protein
MVPFKLILFLFLGDNIVLVIPALQEVINQQPGTGIYNSGPAIIIDYFTLKMETGL